MEVLALLLILVAIIMFAIAGFWAHRFTAPSPSWGWIGALALAVMLLVQLLDRMWA